MKFPTGGTVRDRLRVCTGADSVKLRDQQLQSGWKKMSCLLYTSLKLLRVLAQGDEILPPGRTIIHGAEDPQHIQSVVDLSLIHICWTGVD